MLQPKKAQPTSQQPEVMFVPLPEARQLAFAEYGDPAGQPVIFCHGWPSSCTMAELTDVAARELGVRIISPDRPGICGSGPPAERTLQDWPPVLERLVDHLGLTDFRMLGISGGGPYTFAGAWAMPSRVIAAAVVSSAPPIAVLTNQS